MKGRQFSLVLVYLAVIGKAIYNLLYFAFEADIPLASLGLSYIILFMAIAYLYMDRKNKLKAIQFIPFLAMEIIVAIINIIIVRNIGKTHFTIVEQGVLGIDIGLLINLILIIYILIANKEDIKKFSNNN